MNSNFPSSILKLVNETTAKPRLFEAALSFIFSYKTSITKQISAALKKICGGSRLKRLIKMLQDLVPYFLNCNFQFNFNLI